MSRARALRRSHLGPARRKLHLSEPFATCRDRWNGFGMGFLSQNAAPFDLSAEKPSCARGGLEQLSSHLSEPFATYRGRFDPVTTPFGRLQGLPFGLSLRI